MRLWDFIRSLSLPKLWALFVLCIGNLSKIWPTWKATKKSVAYASEYYGKAHTQNTAANAFRHAVWNYLIIRGCYNKPEQLEAALSWTKKITDLHEELFINDDLAKAMDIHNNKVGRDLFCKYISYNDQEIIELMRKLTIESIEVKSLQELSEVGNLKFAHLVEMKAS